MNEATEKRIRLKAGLASEKPVVTVGAHDAMTAKLIESHDFDAVWVSGFGVSTMAYAMPDINLITMTEALDAAIRIDRATHLPVVADCDNGYGGLNNVVRTALDYERAGISGICVEDNLFPKKNSLLQGSTVRELIPIGEQARRIKAAKQAQQTDEFVFIARIEALIADHGTAAACDRADAYADAGADALLIHSKDPTFAQIEDFLSTWKGLGSIPLVAVPSLYPQYDADELAARGFNMVIFANQAMRASVKAIEDVLELMAKDRHLESADATIATIPHVFDIVETTEAIARESEGQSGA
jgi:phosphoenolpyruvate phosphomutase